VSICQRRIDSDSYLLLDCRSVRACIHVARGNQIWLFEKPKLAMVDANVPESRRPNLAKFFINRYVAELDLETAFV
jgi:hypothetical protein